MYVTLKNKGILKTEIDFMFYFILFYFQINMKIEHLEGIENSLSEFLKN
jgi:hypothetical protein